MGKNVDSKSSRKDKQVAMWIDEDNVVKIDETRMRDAFGSTDPRFVKKIVEQVLIATGKEGNLNKEAADFACSVIEGIQPRDQVEAMLAAQMAAVHNAAMTFARRLNHVDNIAQQDSAEKAFNKLMRTYASQMEALRKYRTGGEQKVTVQHVTVNDGGQAVVGDIRNRDG